MCFCDQCFAQRPFENSNPDLLYKDFRHDAPHKMTRFDHDGYVRCSHVFGKSPWSAVPGWSLNLVFKDIMHVVLLGVARDHVANHICAWLEGGHLNHIRTRLPAAPNEPEADHQLRVLWLDFRKWCKDEGYGPVAGMIELDCFWLAWILKHYASPRQAQRRAPGQPRQLLGAGLQPIRSGRKTIQSICSRSD